MWDDPHELTASANLLFAIAALLALYGIGHYVIHLPVFPLREIQVTGDVAHVTREQVEAVVGEINGNFFTVDLDRARSAFEKLPWVRKVEVRRQWPDSLEFAVEEHRPLARWGSTALVSAQGEVFEAAIDSALPRMQGPLGSAADVVAHFLEFERLLMPLGRRIDQIVLSERRAWILKLDDGMHIELGRDNVQSRLGAFVAAYEQTMNRLPQHITYVDLRYPNGFAVRTSSGPAGVQKKREQGRRINA